MPVQTYAMTLCTIGGVLYSFGGAKGTGQEVYLLDQADWKWEKDERTLKAKMVAPQVVVYNAKFA